MDMKNWLLSALLVLSQGLSAASVYYVSANGKARGADGLTPATAKKDIQAVLDIIKEKNENGSVIRIGAGNFLGAANAGYIEISNWVVLEGGWNNDFTERNPYQYITRIVPTQEQLGTNGSKGLITISGLDDVMARKPKGTLLIDGIMLDMGEENFYKKGLLEDTPPQVQHQLMHSQGWIAGNVIIRNCLFLNGNNFGISIGSRCGEVEIYNCVFISNRLSAVRITGGDKYGEASHVDFHHNTVAFSWCRDKWMEDMGYGYEFMTYVNADVHHNLFVANNYAAVARTHVLSGPDAKIEAKRVTNLYDNYFYLNAVDLQLPAKSGGQWTNIKCSDIEDMVDEKTLPRAENNKALDKNDKALRFFDQDYLSAFEHLTKSSSGPSMYGNRYDFNQAMRLFGAKSGFGAQRKGTAKRASDAE